VLSGPGCWPHSRPGCCSFPDRARRDSARAEAREGQSPEWEYKIVSYTSSPTAPGGSLTLVERLDREEAVAGEKAGEWRALLHAVEQAGDLVEAPCADLGGAVLPARRMTGRAPLRSVRERRSQKGPVRRPPQPLRTRCCREARRRPEAVRETGRSRD
jgi:hypothetical protein